jgi:hypothetical protein
MPIPSAECLFPEVNRTSPTLAISVMASHRRRRPRFETERRIDNCGAESLHIVTIALFILLEKVQCRYLQCERRYRRAPGVYACVATEGAFCLVQQQSSNYSASLRCPFRTEEVPRINYVDMSRCSTNKYYHSRLRTLRARG